MPENPYNGYDNSINESLVQPDNNGLRYNDNSLEDINKVEEYSIDASEQSYVDGNPQKIHFDNPNWNVQPENQSYTDALAIIIAVVSIVVVIAVVYFILRFLRVI